MKKTMNTVLAALAVTAFASMAYAEDVSQSNQPTTYDYSGAVWGEAPEPDRAQDKMLADKRIQTVDRAPATVVYVTAVNDYSGSAWGR